jgi:hypothetical protein
VRAIRFPKRAGFLPALFLCVVLMGCGDDGGSDVTTDAGPLVPSKRDYIVQADTICANSDQIIETEAEIRFKIDSSDFTVTPSGDIVFKPGRRPTDAEIERFAKQVILPAFREQVADLRGLTPPAGDEATVTEVYDAAEAGIDRLQGDPAVFSDSAAVRRELSEAQSLGRRYGFFNCGTYSAP